MLFLLKLMKLVLKRRIVLLITLLLFVIYLLLSYHNVSDKNDVKKPRVSNHVTYEIPRQTRIGLYCNPPLSIKLHDELSQPLSVMPQLTLTKVTVLIRHGDRGPLRPVRNLSAIVCDPLKSHTNQLSELHYKLLSNFITDAKTKMKRLMKFQMSFPFIPNDSKCNLGHLTRFGVSQHLTLGSYIGNWYIDKLHLKPPFTKHVKVFSTQYPRTFQSAVSFLYGFLKPKTIIDFKNFPQIIGSYGIFFCSSDFCGKKCNKMDELMRTLNKGKHNLLESHPAVIRLLNDLRPIVASSKNMTDIFQSPVSIFDGLMSFVCHNSNLPCDETGKCIELDHLRQLIAYIDFHGKQLSKSGTFKHLSWLKVIDFLTELTKDFKHHSKSRFTLYSAHDLTIVALSVALDFYDGSLPPYASRVIFEIYRDKSNNLNYLRLIYNGRDVTQLTEICKTNSSNCFHYADESKRFHLINVETFSAYVKEKFYIITKTNNYENACKV